MKIRYFIFTILLSIFIIGKANAQNQNSLLWRISGDQLKSSSYLFGTIHIADNRAFEFGDSVMPAFEKCETYAMEVLIDSTAAMMMMAKMMMTGDAKLKDLMKEKDYELLKEIFQKQMGTPLDFFEKVQPFFISAMITETLYKKDVAEPLDMHLLSLAKKQGKQTLGIETIDEQFAAMGTLSYKKQAKYLAHGIKDMEFQLAFLEKMISTYREENIDALLELNNLDPMPKKLYKALLTDRNIRMADRISRFIQQSAIFIGVGAMHLSGKDGLIELLRQKGFKVEAVHNN